MNKAKPKNYNPFDMVDDFEPVIEDAVREQMKVKLVISGAGGFGKSRTALKVGYGIIKDWSKIYVADTDNKGFSVHCNTDYDGVFIPSKVFKRIEIPKPHAVDRFIKVIEKVEMVTKGDGLLIIDTLSHAWDFIKDWHDSLGGEWKHWREPKLAHIRLIDRIIQSPLHIIVTVKTRQSTQAVTDSSGKVLEIQKIQNKIIQDEELDYDFTAHFMLTGPGKAQCMKDRTHIFTTSYHGPLSVEEGEMIERWATQGEYVKTIREQEIEAIQEINELRLSNPAIKQAVASYEAQMRTTIDKWGLTKLNKLLNHLKENFPEATDQTVA